MSGFILSGVCGKSVFVETMGRVGGDNMWNLIDFTRMVF